MPPVRPTPIPRAPGQSRRTTVHISRHVLAQQSLWTVWFSQLPARALSAAVDGPQHSHDDKVRDSGSGIRWVARRTQECLHVRSMDPDTFWDARVLSAGGGFLVTRDEKFANAVIREVVRACMHDLGAHAEEPPEGLERCWTDGRAAQSTITIEVRTRTTTVRVDALQETERAPSWICSRTQAWRVGWAR